MTATATGAFIDSTSEVAIEAQLVSLGVAGNLVVVIPVSSGNKVYIGKVVIT